MTSASAIAQTVPTADQQPAAEKPTAGPALDEIVVTAQRRSENAQRVPISIIGVSNENLANASVVSSQQLPTLVPGLVMANNAQTVEPYLRGVGNNNNAPGNELPIAIYVDNVYIASANSTLLDLSDVSNIAVLKGPQGTLFGRNAVAGVIQVTTKEPRPGDPVTADLGLSLDSYETVKADAYLAAPLNENIEASISGTASTQGKGWGKDINTGQDIRLVNHNLGVRGKLIIHAGEATVIKLGADYANRSDNIAANFRGAGNGPVVFPGYTPPKNPWSNDASFPSAGTYAGGGVSAIVDHDLEFAHLVSITAYRRDRLTYRFDLDATPTDGYDLRFPSKTREISQELQLNSNDRGWLKWSLGVYYFNNESGIYGGSVKVNPVSLAITINDTQRATSYSGYGQATAQIFADTRLTLGLRYTEETRDFHGEEATAVGGMTVADALYGPVSVSYSRLTWRAALDHSFTPDVLGYASFNRGFKSGGFNTLAPTNTPYLPETLDAYEAGMKSELLEHRVRLNAAFFWYNRSNIQVNEYTNGVQGIYNGASARVFGLDLDFQTKISNEFSFTGGFVWLDDKFTNFPNAVLFKNDPSTGLPAQYIGSATGARVPFSSKFSGDLGVNYTKPVRSGSINGNFTVYHNSGYYSEPDNVLHQKSFQYLNLRIGWTSSDDRLSVALWGRNLLDVAVASQLATTADVGRLIDVTNPPRTFGISANKKF